MRDCRVRIIPVCVWRAPVRAAALIPVEEQSRALPKLAEDLVRAQSRRYDGKFLAISK